jgi:transcriptional regulator with XRE-family HTH domain
MNADWFGGRLREIREGAGLTQKELADRAGLTREGVAQLETGRREPAWRTVVALCQALGAKCDDFLQPPTERPRVPRGRPRKQTGENPRHEGKRAKS